MNFNNRIGTPKSESRRLFKKVSREETLAEKATGQLESFLLDSHFQPGDRFPADRDSVRFGEHWSGHIGTSNKRIRFNGNSWHRLPLPQGVDGSPECRMAALTKTAIKVPLSDLKDGENRFELTCSRQICNSFEYPAYAVYGITVRIFLNPSAPHPGGRIVTPLEHSSISDNPTIMVEAVNSGSEIRRVDVIALYEGFDWEGNGVYREWHYDMDFTRMRNHVGSTSVMPYGINWNTRWVPDQTMPMGLQARITDSTGVTYVTPAVSGITFARDRSLRMYKSSELPEWFSSRVGAPKFCSIEVAESLADATSARLFTGTHGPHDEPGEFGLNGHIVGTVTPGLPGQDPKRYHDGAVPVRKIKQGENEFYSLSNTRDHALEILWPGPVLFIEFSTK